MKIPMLRSAPAVLIACGALFLTASGGAVAGSLITGAQIKNGTVTTHDIRDKTLIANDLSPAAVKALQGATGEPGAPGEPGATGATGPQGGKGDTGSTGDQGARGETGPQGPEGAQGSDGSRGAPGEQGVPGEPGTPGTPGEPGAPGPRGEVGPAGTSEFSSSTSGTYTVPAGVHLLSIRVWGAGGAASGMSGGGQGGFAGATVYVTPGSTVTFSVGAGGIAGPNPLAGDGGTTTLTTAAGVTLSAPGGIGTREGGGSGGADGTVAIDRVGAGLVTDVISEMGASGSGRDRYSGDTTGGGIGLPGSGGSSGSNQRAPSPGFVIIAAL